MINHSFRIKCGAHMLGFEYTSFRMIPVTNTQKGMISKCSTKSIVVRGNADPVGSVSVGKSLTGDEFEIRFDVRRTIRKGILEGYTEHVEVVELFSLVVDNSRRDFRCNFDSFCIGANRNCLFISTTISKQLAFDFLEFDVFLFE